ncbi:PREDICTED: taste receptor type 2 member 5-like [Chrysochloris asiatica]|uniref:Taste receptor type 2 n=1 Tax=Chrysochloris asiatica TaxID=185453 RepID=A0A9B0TJ12_CHRAS|nr:PREDICTED: taste receptor type 2 member 5-like [Chrysochloris asiatica]
MLTLAQCLLMLVAVAEFFVGLAGNGALVIWSLGEWARRARQWPYSCILLGLATSRFLLQWLIMLDLCLFPLYQSSRWPYGLSFVWVLVSQVNLWFTTFLSVFYCLKITTFEHPAYLWLKQRTYHLNFWCFLGSFIMGLVFLAHVSQNPYSASLGNSSIAAPLLSQHYFYILRLNSGSWLPFLVFLLYCGMLMASLYRHYQKMQVFMAGRRDAQAQAHITALKSLGCFLVLHIVYVLASPFSISAKYPSLDLTSVFFSETLMAASPSLHSAILVLGNPRVKQLCQRVLWKLVGACRSRGP